MLAKRSDQFLYRVDKTESLKPGEGIEQIPVLWKMVILFHRLRWKVMISEVGEPDVS